MRLLCMSVLVLVLGACSAETSTVSNPAATEAPTTTTTVTTTTTTAAYFTVSDELSERQLEMIAAEHIWIEAWGAADGEAVAAAMQPTAVVHYPSRGSTLKVADGSLVDWINSHPEHYTAMVIHGVPYVYENFVVTSGAFEGTPFEFMSVAEFPTTGDLKILRATIFVPPDE